MYTRTLMFLAALGGVVSHSAFAQTPLPVPSSLLIHPEVDNTAGHVTLITITNTNLDPMTGAVDAEFVYINGDNCFELNRIERLTPGDTFTTLSTFHNPNIERGYLYVYALNPTTHQPISFNFLIGASTMIDGISTFDYDVEPFSFRAINAQGTLTDLDLDGRRDLDGLEYEQCPDEILIPRFHGQPMSGGPVPPGSAESELVLLNLTGASKFNAIVNFLATNDNSQLFTAQYQFRCWTKVPLNDISGLFTNDFLQTATTQNPSEPIGAPAIENGWIGLDGSVAYSMLCTAEDPAILAFLIERVSGSNATASLPFSTGRQSNGSLIDRQDTLDGCPVQGDGGPTLRKKQAP